MTRKILFYIVLVFVMGLIISCENYKDCNSPVETSLGVSFRQMVNEEEADSTLPALTMFGIGRADSLLVDDSALSQIYVPLNQTTDTTSFYLQPDSTLQYGDTLTLRYKRTLSFVSSGCGFTTLFNIDTAYSTHHFIDSIALVNRKIITTNAVNLKIFY